MKGGDEEKSEMRGKLVSCFKANVCLSEEGISQAKN